MKIEVWNRCWTSLISLPRIRDWNWKKPWAKSRKVEKHMGSGHNKCTPWGPTMFSDGVGGGGVCKTTPIWWKTWTKLIGLKIWNDPLIFRWYEDCNASETIQGCLNIFLSFNPWWNGGYATKTPSLEVGDDRKWPQSFLWYGGSCSSKIVFTVSSHFLWLIEYLRSRISNLRSRISCWPWVSLFTSFTLKIEHKWCIQSKYGTYCTNQL